MPSHCTQEGRIETPVMSRAPRRAVHQLLAEVLGRRVGILRADRVLLVDRARSRAATRRSGKKKPGTVSLDRFTKRGTPQRTAASSALNVAIRLLPNTTCGGVLGRLGDRGGVDDRVVAADDRERVAGVGQVGLLVGDARRGFASNDGRAEVGGGDVVAGVGEGGDGGGADLAARAGDEDAHPGRLPDRAVDYAMRADDGVEPGVHGQHARRRREPGVVGEQDAPADAARGRRRLRRRSSLIPAESMKSSWHRSKTIVCGCMRSTSRAICAQDGRGRRGPAHPAGAADPDPDRSATVTVSASSSDGGPPRAKRHLRGIDMGRRILPESGARAQARQAVPRVTGA